jgi:signal transduction histidine kinase
MTPLRRFAPLIALLTAVMLLAGSVGFLFYIDRVDRHENARAVAVQADILGSTVTAALSFDDRPTAREYVAALAADPDIRAVGVYDTNGGLFAGYTRTAADALPATTPASGAFFAGDRLRVAKPIRQDGATIGQVYIETAIEAWPRRLERYGIIGFITLMAALSVAALGAAQTAMGRANSALERQARELSAANASLQTEMTQRATAEEALRQAQKLEVIGQLTGGVAHDFNNLLQIIIGNLDTLRRRGFDRPELRRPLDAAIRGAERAAVLTQSLLAFARRQPLAPRPLDVNRVVENIFELLHRTLGESIRIATVLTPDLCSIAADPSQLDTTLVNLAVNARDAMPTGGTLTIETRNARLEAGAVPDEVTPGNYVLIAVADTGAGMPQSVRDRAFEPFFTTKDIGKGSGLGLSQVYGFIRQSGGHAAIESSPGKGTRVSLYLPRLEDGDAAAATVHEALQPPRGHNELVLVVEDEPDVRDNAVQMLRELGYSALVAASGNAALALLTKEPGIQLLFSDIGLPGGMTGRQLAAETAKLRPELPILLTTGYAQGDSGDGDSGVALIAKPFSFLTLGVKLRQVIDRRAASPDHSLAR